MSISPTMVKELREKTGAGMMDCKKALAESNGDIDAAVEFLRKKGISTAAKKAGRTAADGLIGTYISDDSKLAVMVEVNCETDFVTKLEDFQEFVNKIPTVVRDADPANIDELLEAPYDGSTVREAQTNLVAKIGENLGVRRFAKVKVDGTGKIANYVHAGSKIGVVVAYDDPAGKLDEATAREVAMHVAAMNPRYVKREDVPESVIAKEKEIMKAQMGDMKKPPEIMDKIITGKLGKVFTEICLEDQVYVRDPDGKSTVKQWLEKLDKGIKVKSFERLQVGEGVEKKSD